MKLLFVCLLFPFFTSGQTIHFDDDRIQYKGNVNLQENSAAAIQSRLQVLVPLVAGKMTDTVTISTTDSSLIATGELRLKTPYHIVRKAHFTMHLVPKQNSYTYNVDSVYVTERRRGGKEKLTSTKAILEGLEETGAAEIETEILVNEIDLRIQKLLRVLENRMKEVKTAGNQMMTSTANTDN